MRQYRRHSSSNPPTTAAIMRRRRNNTSHNARRDVVEWFRLRSARDRSSGSYSESFWRGCASGTGREPQSHEDTESLSQVSPAVPDEKPQLRKLLPLCFIGSISSIEPVTEENQVWKLATRLNSAVQASQRGIARFACSRRSARRRSTIAPSSTGLSRRADRVR